MEKLHDIIDSAVGPGSPKYVSPSAAAVVVDRNGDVIFQRSSGILRDNLPLSDDAVWWMASQTKLVTTVAAMQTVQQGLIGLDDDVCVWLPELASLNVFDGIQDSHALPQVRPRTGNISLRLLLSHQSGVGYDILNPEIINWKTTWGLVPGAMDGSLAAMREYPLLFEPGTNWSYGMGIDWAGQLVSRVHGITLEEYMKQHIFEPLGMTSTTFHPEAHGLLDKIPESYTRDPITGGLTPVSLPLTLPAKEECGGHGLFATVGDFAKLLSAILSDGGSILTKESVDQIFSPQLIDPTRLSQWAYGPYKSIIAPAIPKDLDIDHGLGGIINMEPISGRRSKGSLQWLGMVNQFWWIDREAGIAGSVFLNLRPTGDTLAWNHHMEFEKQVYSCFRNK